MARAGEAPEVVLEATYGWYWAVDALAELGATRASGASAGGQGVFVPAGEKRSAGCRGSGRPAADGSAAAGVDRAAGDPGAAGAGAASGQTRRDASSCKAEVHAVLAKCGVWVPMTDLFGLAGTRCWTRSSCPAVRGADRLAAPGHRRAGFRDRPVHRAGPRPAGP